MAKNELRVRTQLLASILFALFVFPFSASAVATFERTYGGSGWDGGWSVQQTLDRGYIIAGATPYLGSGKYDVYLVKTDSLGNVLWEETYGEPYEDKGYSVQQTLDGGYVIAGKTYSFGGYGVDGDVYLIKTDSLGHLLWERTYGGSEDDEGWSVQQTSDRGYIVAGYTGSFGAGYTDVCLFKTDSLGNVLWEKTYGGESTEYGYSVDQTVDGGYVVAGHTRIGAGNYDFYLVKTDSLGNLLWERTYGGSENDRGYSVQQTSDGGYVIAGYTESFGAGSGDVYLVRTDSLGNVLWEKTYGGSRSDAVYDVQQTLDGGFILGGHTYSFTDPWGDVYLVKTDSLGNSIWEETHGGSRNDWGYSVQQTLDGGYVVAGNTASFGAGQADMYLIKTDRHGRVRSCTPVEPWQVRTQGYWRRQCKGNLHEDICVYTDSIHALTDLFDAFDCDSICDLVKVDPPERDMCRKAKRQFMALLLNVASGKLAICNCLEDGSEVGDVVAEIDSLLLGSPDHAMCVYAKTLANNINNGIGIVPCDTLVAPARPKSVLPVSCSVNPNPFISSTLIQYELWTPQPVQLQIYDKAGRLVRTLLDSNQSSGPYYIEWDGLDEASRKVPAGIYFSRLQIGKSVASSKLILLR